MPGRRGELFSYRTPGEDITQATSINGQPYSSLPNALKYRQSFDAACSCKAAGQSWADALGKDEAVESRRHRGDGRPRQADVAAAAQKGQPKTQQKGRRRLRCRACRSRPPRRPAARGRNPPHAAEQDRPVRAVGPTFIAGAKQP